MPDSITAMTQYRFWRPEHPDDTQSILTTKEMILGQLGTRILIARLLTTRFNVPLIVSTRMADDIAGILKSETLPANTPGTVTVSGHTINFVHTADMPWKAGEQN